MKYRPVISDSSYSIYPSANATKEGLSAYHTRLLASLSYLVGEAADALGVAFPTDLIRFHSVESNACFIPELFYSHDALLKAMQEQRMDDVVRRLESLATFLATRHIEPTPPQIDSLGHSEWEQFIVDNAESTMVPGCAPFILRPVPDAERRIAQDQLGQAVGNIQRVFPEMYGEVLDYAKFIKVFEGQITMGVTDVRMFHCMFIRRPRSHIDPVLYFSEHLVHETSHMHLNALMAGDPIILNDRSELFASPLRPDGRPMLGVFHAMFVTTRIVQFFLRLVEQDQREKTLQHLVETFDELIRGVKEIEVHAKVTARGAHLLSEARGLVDTATDRIRDLGFSLAEEREHRFGAGRSRVEAARQQLAS